MSTANESNSSTSAATEPYVRLARTDEIEALAHLVGDAFISDAMMHYFGGLKTPLADESADSRTWRTYRAFQAYTLRECVAAGARITVAVLPADGQAEERAVAMTVCFPPHKRISGTEENAVHRGVGPVIEGWGRGWIQREEVFFERSTAAVSDALAARGIDGGPLGVWYLMIAATRPGYQGKGYLSRLMREMYAFIRDGTITLDATSTKSRAAYLHLGFELVKTINIGQGEVNSRGLLAGGEEATGWEFHSMVKWLFSDLHRQEESVEGVN